MAGVKADPEALFAAGGVQQRRQLLEGPSERAAGARCVLEVQGTALALRERLCEERARAADRLTDVAALGGAGRFRSDRSQLKRCAGCNRGSAPSFVPRCAPRGIGSAPVRRRQRGSVGHKFGAS